MKNEMRSKITDLFLAELLFPVQCLEECWRDNQPFMCLDFVVIATDFHEQSNSLNTYSTIKMIPFSA